MAINYLNLSSARDLDKPIDKFLYRFFEILPGFFAWLTLIAAVLFSWLAPFWMAVFIIIFDLYWFLRVTYLALHQVATYQKMKKNIAADWLQKLKTEKRHQWRRVYHLVILPFVNEEESVIRSTLHAIENCVYPHDRLIIAFALEERSRQTAESIVQKLINEYQNKFFALTFTVHPAGIPGEIAGKGANVEWCAKELNEKFLTKFPIKKQYIITSIFDIDTKPYPQYFACLAWHYLDVSNPLRASFQPIPVYNNNIWEASAMSRVIATSSTFWQMMQQERPEQLVTFSSHAMSFMTLLDVGYPRNNVSDDSRIYWRAYFKYKGDYRVVPLYYPVSMDAVIAPSLWRTIINQYKQQRRWSWGVENVPYVFFNFFKNPTSKDIPLFKKLIM